MSDEELFQLLRANGLNECDAACDRIAELLDEGSVMANHLDSAEILINKLVLERTRLLRKSADAESKLTEAMVDGILTGMNIAVTVPIDQVPQAIESIVRAIRGDA